MSFLSRFFKTNPKAPKEFREEIEVENPHPHEIEVWFEPWGIPHALAAGESFRVVTLSPQAGSIEVETQETLMAVYGWSECTMKVFKGEEQIDDLFALPELGKGITPAQFIHTMFGGPGGPNRA